MQKARGIFPNKTAHHLAAITGDPLRTWEYWLSKERMPAEALGALLASDHGLEFLDIIAGASPWWRKVRAALALADQQKHAMEEAANALRKLTQAPVGLGLSDMAGAEDCSVARRFA